MEGDTGLEILQDTGIVQTEAPVAMIQVEVEREMEPEGEGVGGGANTGKEEGELHCVIYSSSNILALSVGSFGLLYHVVRSVALKEFPVTTSPSPQEPSVP